MLSILIVTWRTRDLLDACLASIAATPPGIPTEIIVVDNDSGDGSAEMVAQKYPQVKLVLPGANTGYAKGNNLAFAAAEGEFLLTLNPDTEVPAGCLDTAVAAMESHPKVGCVAVKLVGTDGKTQRSVRGFPTVTALIGEVSGLANRFPESSFGAYSLRNFDYEREQPAPQPMGTFLLFRRAALAEIGSTDAPFDEAFPIFFNEVDLLYRLSTAGWPCLYTPRAWVRHHGGESTKQVRKAMIWESHRSFLRYLWKHHGRGPKAVGLAVLSVAMFVAAFVRARGYSGGFRVKHHHL